MQILITLIAHAAGPAHQFDGVVLGETFTDPVAALLIVDPPEHLGQLSNQRAPAIFTDQRQAAIQINRFVRRQAATPHGIVGADNQQLGRVTRKHGLHLGPDKRQQRQHIHAPHALPARRGDGDFGFAQARSSTAQVPGEHPARGSVEQPGNVVDTKFMLADAGPGGFDALPTIGQLEFKA
ncbi:hypothetical protein D9M71_560640 [compost metagenome]